MHRPASNERVDVRPAIEQLLARHPSITMAFLFGSMAAGRAPFNSDLDPAVAAAMPLTRQARLDLIEDLAMTFGRPVELIDQICRLPLSDFQHSAQAPLVSFSPASIEIAGERRFSGSSTCGDLMARLGRALHE